MKKILTLTKALTLLVLLAVFTAASASTVLKDDSSKCQSKCCKAKKDKAFNKAMAEFNAAMKALNAEMKTMKVVSATELKQSLRAINYIRFTRPVFAYAAAEPEFAATDASQKINFSNLDKEMDAVQEQMSRLDVQPDKSEARQKINFSALDQEMTKVQEDLSQMDDSLKSDDAKTRKSADTLLKTGIKY